MAKEQQPHYYNVLPEEEPPVAASYPPAQGLPLYQRATGGEGQWSTRLCGCFEDPQLCCMTCWCPCITFGRIAEIVDRGSSSCGTSGALYGVIMGISALMGLPGLQFLYSCFYRSKMRAQHNLAENPCVDGCVHFWCEPCALCQEYRELRNRGYDMNIGWEENMRKFQDANTVGIPPPVHGGMNR